MVSENDQQWIEEQEAATKVGQDMVQRASDEALTYLSDAVENINDKAWRKMVVSTQAVEMGAGTALAESLIPIVYNDMMLKFTKKMKLPRTTAQALREIYIGRVIKNITKELHERV